MTLFVEDNRPKYSTLYEGNMHKLRMDMNDYGGSPYDKAAVSAWLQRTAHSAAFEYPLWLGGVGNSSGTAQFYVRFETSGRIRVNSFHNVGTPPALPTVVNNFLITSTAITDTNWHHVLVHFDPLNATSTERVKVWLDGTLETAFSYSATANVEIRSGIGIGSYANIGGSNSNVGQAYDGLQYQTAIFRDVLPAIGDVRSSSGTPLYIPPNTPGLESMLTCPFGDVFEDDVQATDWEAAVDAPVSSTTIPAQF